MTVAPAYLMDAKPFPRPHPHVRDGSWAIINRKPAAALKTIVERYTLEPTRPRKWVRLAAADAMVTTRRGYARWHGFARNQSFQQIAAAAGLPASGPGSRPLRDVLKRIAEVTRYLAHEGHPSGAASHRRPAFQPSIGPKYIGINAESGTPRRPMNIACTRFQQRDIVVTLDGQALDVRYVQAGTLEGDEKIILYLHGLGSRAEEADLVATELRKLHDGYTIIAPDLPGHGCTDCPPPGDELGMRYGKNGNPPRGFPFLERLERFVAAFLEAMEKQRRGFRSQVVLVAGGSLGGTLAMRLSMDGSPYRPRSVALWSPAGLWGAFNADDFKRPHVCDPILAKAVAGDFQDPNATIPLGRKFYFDFNFVDRPWPLNTRNYERWWSKAFLAKYGNELRRNAVVDRLELYREPCRQWQMRLAYEQLCFSIHHTKTKDQVGGSVGEGMRPILLLCGSLDNDFGAKIFDNTKRLYESLAAKQHPGRAVWVMGGGHSLHDETPAILAEAIHAFVLRFQP